MYLLTPFPHGYFEGLMWTCKEKRIIEGVQWGREWWKEFSAEIPFLWIMKATGKPISFTGIGISCRITFVNILTVQVLSYKASTKFWKKLLNSSVSRCSTTLYPSPLKRKLVAQKPHPDWLPWPLWAGLCMKDLNWVAEASSLDRHHPCDVQVTAYDSF